jgi:hypothetical protein
MYRRPPTNANPASDRYALAGYSIVVRQRSLPSAHFDLWIDLDEHYTPRSDSFIIYFCEFIE